MWVGSDKSREAQLRTLLPKKADLGEILLLNSTYNDDFGRSKAEYSDSCESEGVCGLNAFCCSLSTDLKAALLGRPRDQAELQQPQQQKGLQVSP